MLLLVAALPAAFAFSAGSGRACWSPQQRRTSAAVCAAALSPAAIELKEEIFELMREVRNRGIEAPPELANDILEVATEMDEMNAGEDWHIADSGIGGTWRLMYTSSRSALFSVGVLLPLLVSIALLLAPRLAHISLSLSPSLPHAQPLPTTKVSPATRATLPAWTRQSCS